MDQPSSGDRDKRYDILATIWTQKAPWPMSLLPRRVDWVVEMDLPCVGCDYNLRTLRAAGRCPECGKPVVDSLGDMEDNRRLNRVRIGMVVLIVIELCWFVFWGAITLVWQADHYPPVNLRVSLAAVDFCYLLALVATGLMVWTARRSQKGFAFRGPLVWLGSIGIAGLLLLLEHEPLLRVAGAANRVHVCTSLLRMATADLVIFAVACGIYPLVACHARRLLVPMVFWIAQLPVVALMTWVLVYLTQESRRGDAPLLLLGMHGASKLVGLWCLYHFIDRLARLTRWPVVVPVKNRKR